MLQALKINHIKDFADPKTSAIEGNWNGLKLNITREIELLMLKLTYKHISGENRIITSTGKAFVQPFRIILSKSFLKDFLISVIAITDLSFPIFLLVFFAFLRSSFFRVGFPVFGFDVKLREIQICYSKQYIYQR